MTRAKQRSTIGPDKPFRDFVQSLRTVYIDEGVEVEGLNSAANVRDIVNFAQGVHRRAKQREQQDADSDVLPPHPPASVPSDYAWGQDPQPAGDQTVGSEEAAAYEAVFAEFLDMNRRIRVNGDGDKVSLEELELWRQRFLPAGTVRRKVSDPLPDEDGGTPLTQLPSYCKGISRSWRWIPTDRDYQVRQTRPDKVQVAMREEYLKALREFEGTPVTQWEGAPEKCECPQCRQMLLCINCTITRRKDPLQEHPEYQMLCRAVTHVVEGMRRDEEDELDEALGKFDDLGGPQARERVEERNEMHRKLQAKYNALMMKQPWCQWLKKKDYDLIALAKQQDDAIRRLKEEHERRVNELTAALHVRDERVHDLEGRLAEAEHELKHRPAAAPDPKPDAAALLASAFRAAMFQNLRLKAARIQDFCDQTEAFVSSALKQLVDKIEVLNLCVKNVKMPIEGELDAAAPSGQVAAVQSGLVRAVAQLWRAFDDCKKTVCESISALREGRGQEGAPAAVEPPADTAPAAPPRLFAEDAAESPSGRRPKPPSMRRKSSARRVGERGKQGSQRKRSVTTVSANRRPSSRSLPQDEDAQAPAKPRKKKAEDHVYMKGDVYRQASIQHHQTVSLPMIRSESQPRRPVAVPATLGEIPEQRPSV